MLVQIYEVNNVKEAFRLTEAGVDHIGVLIGKGKYPRELSFADAKKIFDVLPIGVKSVGLTQEKDLDEISEAIEKANPDIFHIGSLLENSSTDDLKYLKNKFPNTEFMRTIPVIDESSIEIAKSYDGLADYLLLDTYNKGNNQIGATGATHDWNISERIVNVVKIPVILAGGLGPDNVANAIMKVKPAGVDSKTRTDRNDGKGKDIEKVKLFVRCAKAVVP